MNQDKSQKPHKRFPWVRLLIALTLSFLCSLGALLLILSTGHIIAPYWYYIVPAIFTAIGLIVPLLQWLFPISTQGEPQEGTSLSSVALVSTSLVVNESSYERSPCPYKQTVEQGRKTIRYSEQLSGKDMKCLFYFPAIDFKFQNTGAATAILWQYEVKVLQANIDRTPALDFTSDIHEKALRIVVANNGWGPAHDCIIQLDEPSLNQIFSQATRSLSVSIESGAQQEVLLKKEHIQTEAFEAIGIELLEYFARIVRDEIIASYTWRDEYFRGATYDPSLDIASQRVECERQLKSQRAEWEEHIKSLRESFMERMSRYILAIADGHNPNPDRKDFLPREKRRNLRRLELVHRALEEYVMKGSSSTKIPGISEKRVVPFKADQGISVLWSCRDTNNILHKGQEQIRVAPQKRKDFKEHLILTQDGFVLWDYRIFSRFAMSWASDRVYAAIIDPSSGAHARTYSLSRKIPAKDVDRFQVMVGSTASCNLLVQFRFFFDQTTIIESEIFDMKIWNSRKLHWHTHYPDGAVFRQTDEASGGGVLWISNRGLRKEPSQDFAYNKRH